MASHKYRIQTLRDNVSIANGQTTGTGTVVTNPTTNGTIKAIYINCPVLTGASYTINILGPDTGSVLFTKASLTPNAVTNIVADANNVLLDIPYVKDCSVQIVSAGAEGAPRTIPYTLLIDRG